jgi:hypothetical protein
VSGRSARERPDGRNRGINGRLVVGSTDEAGFALAGRQVDSVFQQVVEEGLEASGIGSLGGVPVVDGAGAEEG